eukprot:4553828-Alexandrium_andersonii.AAC.1
MCALSRPGWPTMSSAQGSAQCQFAPIWLGASRAPTPAALTPNRRTIATPSGTLACGPALSSTASWSMLPCTWARWNAAGTLNVRSRWCALLVRAS